MELANPPWAVFHNLRLSLVSFPAGLSDVQPCKLASAFQGDEKKIKHNLTGSNQQSLQKQILGLSQKYTMSTVIIVRY